MGLFGNSTAVNSDLVYAQLAEAIEAEILAAEQEARRTDAKNQIEAIFQGGTYTPTTTEYTFDPDAYLATYTDVAADAFYGNDPYAHYVQHGYGEGRDGYQETVTTEDPIEYTGITDDFYDEYRQSILDYYEPQLTDDYSDAAGQLLLGFSSRGTRNSSAAANAQAQLLEDYNLQYADLYQTADESTEAYKSGIEDEMYALLDLASSAEDPTTYVDRALTEVNAVQPAATNLSPLGDVFSAAALAYGAYQDEQNRQSYYTQAYGGSGGGSKFGGSGSTVK